MEHLASLTDDELLAAYQMTDGDPDHPATDEIFAEIARRGLDV